jgi:ferritin-like metal-binding protein YciE
MRFTSLKLNSLRDLLLEELRNLYNAEQQLVEALPKMAKAAKAPDLKSAFNHPFQAIKARRQVVQAFTRSLPSAWRPAGSNLMAIAA